MAKYNWQELEKEFVLGNYKSINDFLKERNIPYGSSVRKKTKDWKVKKSKKEARKSEKVIEKVIEKESTKEANEILKTKDTAEKLLKKINKSIEELDRYVAKTTTKTKTVKYDYKALKPKEEVTVEQNVINEYKAIIDRFGLKQLAAALKDINDVLNNENGNNDSKRKVTIINDLPKRRS